MKHMTLFVSAAVLLALAPGPGMFYVMARSLANGTKDGLRSSAGTFFGGMFHVLAAGLGASAILATSAIAFAIVKFAGAAYLVVLGVRMLLQRDVAPSLSLARPSTDALLQGIWTEVLNPKTALFFLSFLPQFVSANGHVFQQFLMLGSISVTLNTLADIAVACLAGPFGSKFAANRAWNRRQRTASGLGMIGLGVYVAASDAA